MVEVFKVYAQGRVPQPHLPLQLVLMTRMRRFHDFFTLSPALKKCEGHPAGQCGVVADTSSSELSAHQMAGAHSSPSGERTELVDDNGHVWGRLDTVHGSFWKNLDTQHSQWHLPWEL